MGDAKQIHLDSETILDALNTIVRDDEPDVIENDSGNGECDALAEEVRMTKTARCVAEPCVDDHSTRKCCLLCDHKVYPGEHSAVVCCGCINHQW